jgi:hypothetical protein
MTDQTTSAPPEPKRRFHASASIACHVGSAGRLGLGDEDGKLCFRARDNKLGSKTRPCRLRAAVPDRRSRDQDCFRMAATVGNGLPEHVTRG